MKKFETPELEILEFTVMDVITTTNDDIATSSDMGEWA